MNIVRTLIYIFLISVFIIALGAVMVLTERTLAPWWPFWCGALAIGLILGLILSGATRRVTGWKNRPVNHLLATVYCTVVIAGGLYTLNYACIDETTEHIEQVVVEKKYTKTRHRSQRVGRRYRQGAPYKVYFIDVVFADGRATSLEIPQKRYNRIRTGSTTELRLATGILGAPVIKF